MLSKKMQKALNGQINAELYSGYLYLSMSSYCEESGLPGFATWMRAQAQEETAHAMKFFSYVCEAGAKVELKAIDAPATSWDSPQAMFSAVLDHEQKVTKMINKLVDLAIEEKDHATNAMLQWFVTEQVEEEAHAGEICQKLKLMGDAPGGLFMMDRELGSRTFAIPADLQGGQE